MNSKNNTPLFTNTEFSWKSGKNWFDAGVMYFKQVKMQWYSVCIMLGVLMVLIGNVSPELVTIMMVFASPMVSAFMMNCCQQASNLSSHSLAMLWKPVIENFNAFIILGVLTALLSLLLNYLQEQILLIYDLPVVMTEEMV